MGDLIAFTRARLDEDEAVARAAMAETPACRRCGGRATGEWHIDPEHDPVIKDAGAAACSQVVVYNDGSPAVNEHIARHDPARVLREVEAGRNILARYEDCLARMEDPEYPAAVARDQAREYEDFVLPNLAFAWSDHQDYDPEWLPAGVS